MERFEFTKAKIDHHIEKVGVDIRPVFEMKLDRDKLYAVGQKLVDTYPNLFESLVQSPSNFRIMKKFVFPKAEVEIATLSSTQRGIVFTFPRIISEIDEELELDPIDDIIVECLKKFRATFAEKKIIRVGLVNDYIFGTAEIYGATIICERFTKLSVPVGGEIKLKINRPTDDYNRSIELQPVRKVRQVPEVPEQVESFAHGIRVNVDFNNRDMSKNLDVGQILRILHEGQKYNDSDLYTFLNSGNGGE